MATEKKQTQRAEPRHSIAVVSRRTGISQLLLRAWERRYGAVDPARTDTGRRLYTDEDLEKLALLGRLTGEGHRIGDIANMTLVELRELVEESIPAREAPVLPGGPAAPASEYLKEALAAVAAMDADALESTLGQALVHLSKPVLRMELITPLLEEIGSRWCDGRLRIAHEHLATRVIIQFLSGVNARFRVAPDSPLVVVATPGGTNHEVGALLASSLAYEAGWDVLNLGSNVPAEELAAAVAARNARAVMLSIVFPEGDPAIADQFRMLRKLVGPDLPILVGGRAAGSYRDVLVESGARLIGPADNLTSIFSNL